MTLWRPRGGPSVPAPSRRLAVRPRLHSLETRWLPSTTVAPLIAFGADAGHQPLVTVYDTATGAYRHSFLAYDAGYRGGVRVATGDVTGDGVDDIVTGIGPGSTPLVKVFDGVSGQELTSFLAYDERFRGGVYVAVSDINDDGHADILTGAGAGGGPHVKVFNGAWAVPPFTPTPTTPPTPPPPVVDPPPAPPIDGAPVETIPGVEVPVTETPTVPETPAPPPVLSTMTAVDTTTAELRSFMAYDVRFAGGVTVAAGDVNGDGHTDIITGAGPGGGPHVRAVSGVDGSELLSFFAYASVYTGGVYVSAGDVDGDGQAEIVAGSGGRGLMQTRLYDDDGRLLRTFEVAGQNSPLSVHVGMVDIDHDGREDLLTSAGHQVQVRNPENNAVKGIFALSDPAYLNGVFAD